MSDARRCGFVAVVGRPNVGKSTLTNALVGQKVAIVSDKPQTTRNRILAVVNRPGGQIVLLDTPGIHKPMHRMNERMVELAMQSVGQAELVLWVHDVTEPWGPGDRFVRDRLKQAHHPLVIALNKIDRIEKPRLLPLLGQLSQEIDALDMVPISARDGDGVEQLAEVLLKHLPEGEPLYPEDYLSDQPERFFVAEMVREQILRLTREELPYSVGVLIERFEEGEKLTRIHAVVLVERDGQKAILIGKGGSMLKTVGQAAREEIEKFLGTKVFLGLFVKVRAHWREDPGILEEMGLGSRRG